MMTLQVAVNPDPSSPRPLRDRHADVTRRAILEAARRLFTELGYANTPIRRLAEDAGVAVQTIYATFGSKPGVLVGLLDLVDQQSVEPIVRRLMAANDPEEVVKLVAAMQRGVREAGGDLLRLVAQGAASDPEVARVWEEGFDRHRQGIAHVCERLRSGGNLRKELSLDDATATMLALTSLEAHDELVHRRGWTHDRYETWLRGALRTALLDAPRTRV